MSYPTISYWSYCGPPPKFGNRLNLAKLVLILLVITATGLLRAVDSVVWASSAQKSTSVVSHNLEPDKPFERALAAGEAHSYQVALTVGQYALVEVDQRGIDVVVWAFDPAGKKLVEVDLYRVGEVESIVLLGEIPGAYRLEVRSTFGKAPSGRYEIKIRELRAATEEDKMSVAGGKLIADGIQLEREQTADAWRKAIDKYRQSIPLWQSIKDSAWEANATYLIAGAYINLGEKQNAFDFANKAIPLAQAGANVTDAEKKRKALKVEAYALDTLGRVHNEFGDKKKALEIFDQSLAIRRANHDRDGEIYTINNIAIAYQYMGDSRRALEFFSQAAELLRSVGDYAKEATILNNMCVTYEDLGDYRTGLSFCDRALAIRRDLDDRLGEATVLNNMGSARSSLGEYQQAKDLYNRSAAIYKDLGSKQGEGIELTNLGWLYGTLGDYQKADDFYQKALEIFRDQKDRFREGNVLNNIAVNYFDREDYRKALEINQEALKLRRETHNFAGEGITLTNIASCYTHLAEPQKAFDYYNQSIELQRERNPRQLAAALRNVGGLYRDQGDLQKALVYLNEALQITQRIGDINGEAQTLSQIARVERNRGNLVEARRNIEAALATVESVRINLQSQQLRASFFASARKYHELQIDVLMSLHKEHPADGFDVAALQASENARARSLLELLTEANAEINQGVDPALVERERTLRQAISEKAERQAGLRASSTSEEATRLGKELDTLASEYEEVQTKIRQSSPRYAALTQPVPLSAKEIQSELIDQDTVLLEYALGAEQSFVWVVTPNSLRTFVLPKRDEVETVARRAYDLLTTSVRTVPDETLVQRRKRLEQADAEYVAAAAELSKMLLGPVAAELKNKRLLIVGEGVLQYVPFAALPDPSVVSNQPKDDAQPLVVNHEIISLPSASVLGVLRRETTNRAPAAKTVAVFADPVFEARDPRIAIPGMKSIADSSAAAPEVVRSAEESGLNGFPRLRFTRQEADQIMRFAPGKSSAEALDFFANRSAATSPDLRQYRILHFATHGLINSRHAELSGIVLSLVNQKGEPQNGFLRLYDIYNMNLAADLVVLSACQTALGKDIKGEGLVGLTRAFMYAGATRVVASLWQTEDRATAVLMKHFYEAVLAHKMSPAAALRKAQLTMWQDNRWRQPRYWAAFTLQGEWK